MEPHLTDWLSLLLRWLHVIAGVAWIGASFYFNWLENRLQRGGPQAEGIEGYLWAVHGGGFYRLEKFRVAPEQLPAALHWFKWEAYVTWLSGAGLLAVVYYWDAKVYLIDPAVMALSAPAAVAVGAGSLVASWLVYDLLCRLLQRHPLLLAAAVFAFFALLAFVLCQLLSGRAAYLHTGAAMGTVMVANVLRVIIPSQKSLVRSVELGRAPDPQLGASALVRSRHNNYLTLPVLFVMVSGHYPLTYGHPWNWALLAAVSAAGVLVRHYFNVRHRGERSRWRFPAAAVAVIIAVAALTAPWRQGGGDGLVSTAAIRPVIEQRCTVCHARAPTFPGFTAAPGGVALESEAQMESLARRIYDVTVKSKTMPPGNLSAMTDEERALLGRWFTGLDAAARN